MTLALLRLSGLVNSRPPATLALSVPAVKLKFAGGDGGAGAEIQRAAVESGTLPVMALAVGRLSVPLPLTVKSMPVMVVLIVRLAELVVLRIASPRARMPPPVMVTVAPLSRMRAARDGQRHAGVDGQRAAGAGQHQRIDCGVDGDGVAARQIDVGAGRGGADKRRIGRADAGVGLDAIGRREGGEILRR